jgi:hypothetical protein
MLPQYQILSSIFSNFFIYSPLGQGEVFVAGINNYFVCGFDTWQR